jgi:hypothetical protein
MQTLGFPGEARLQALTQSGRQRPRRLPTLGDRLRGEELRGRANHRSEWCRAVYGAVGDTGHPPILLIMGIGSSMLWWEEDFWPHPPERRTTLVSRAGGDGR